MKIYKHKDYYQSSDQNTFGLTTIFFDEVKDRLLEPMEGFTPLNNIHLFLNGVIVAAYWDTVANDFRNEWKLIQEDNK